MFFDECNGDGVVWLRVEVEIDNGCFCFCIFGIFFRGYEGFIWRCLVKFINYRFWINWELVINGDD